MIKYHTYSKGNTILETVIYVGLLGFILAFVFSSALGMYRASINARVSRDVNNSAVASMDRITRSVRDSYTISTASSTLTTSPGVLSLTSAYATGGSGEIKFYTSGTALMMKNGTDTAISLLAPNVKVNSLIFYKVVTTHGEAVRYTITLTASVGDKMINRTYYGTAVLRESYQ